MPVIPATQEAEMEKTAVGDELRQKDHSPPTYASCIGRRTVV
jgi:hypothetical protein